MTAVVREPIEAFELKGEMSMLGVLRLFDPNTDRVAQELPVKVEQAPGIFHSMPVIIDLQEIAKRRETPVFPTLIKLLREHGLVPVGVRNGSNKQNKAANKAGLALLHHTQRLDQFKSSSQPHHTTGLEVDSPDPAYVQPRRTRLVVRPVRSGQQLCAANGDLVVVAPASAGSELLADGCIHVYGPLRGRALAGINGDEKARIFCQRLEAELIAIAGHYQISEELAPELKGKPAQIWLDNQRLIISPL